MSFLDTLEVVLMQDERLVAEGGFVMKNKAYDLGVAGDASLLKLLINNADTKAHFFKDVGGVLVFDSIKFGWTITSKEFLPDSYTKYKNKIGLVDRSGRSIAQSNEVCLVWPYKDCVLEGGQTKEDQKRNEIFYNETLAPEEINRLMYPKVFTAAKRYSKDDKTEIAEIKDKDNLIIKGNNLLVLSSLLKRYEGRVQCVCIDPPYNKETNEFGYNDNFNHSTWLTFMKTRLEIAQRLLSRNGTLFCFCDDSEQAYLRVLVDDIFGREKYIQTVVWKNCDNSNNDAKQFSQDHNYILVYSNNEKWESYKLDRTPEQAGHYKNPDNDPRGPWFDGNPVNSPNPRQNLRYTLTASNGNVINPPANGWRWDKEELKRRMETGEIRFNLSNTNIVRRTYLNEQGGLPPSSLWEICDDDRMWLDIDETGHTRQAKYEQKKLYPGVTTSELFSTPKPERVIKKILQISTRKNDVVLDFFGGSGTTAAVAHKMSRQYILCEQMDYIDTYILERLKKVVSGEQGGISKELVWKGGGSFVYCELKQLNEHYIEKAMATTKDEEIIALLEEIKRSGFISQRVNPSDIDIAAKDFNDLSFEDKRHLFLELVNKNMLYVNLCDMDDVEFKVTAEEKAFTNSFYGRISHVPA